MKNLSLPNAAAIILRGIEFVDRVVRTVKINAYTTFYLIKQKFNTQSKTNQATLPTENEHMAKPIEDEFVVAKNHLKQCSWRGMQSVFRDQKKAIKYHEHIQSQSKLGLPDLRVYNAAIMNTDYLKECYTLHLEPLFSKHGLLQNWNIKEQEKLANALAQIDILKNHESKLYTSKDDSQFDPDILTQDPKYEFFSRIRQYDNTPKTQGVSRLCIWLKPENGWIKTLEGCDDFPQRETIKLHDNVKNQLANMEDEDSLLKKFIQDCWNANEIHKNENEDDHYDYLLSQVKRLRKLNEIEFANQELRSHNDFERATKELIFALHKDKQTVDSFLREHSIWRQESNQKLQKQWLNCKPLLSKVQESIERNIKT